MLPQAPEIFNGCAMGVGVLHTAPVGQLQPLMSAPPPARSMQKMEEWESMTDYLRSHIWGWVGSRNADGKLSVDQPVGATREPIWRANVRPHPFLLCMLVCHHTTNDPPVRPACCRLQYWQDSPFRLQDSPFRLQDSPFMISCGES